MKTIMLLSCATLAAALAACADKNPPPQAPATNNTTTTTAFSPAPAPMTTMDNNVPAQTSSLDDSTGSMATTGVSDGQQSAGASATTKFNQAAPVLNEPEAAAKPVQPAMRGNQKSAKSATDQGQSKSEVQATASIRKRMMASKTLSFGAKNTKIITQGTNVTLIGTVKSAAEKSEIEGIARNTDGIQNVDDQLIVKGE